MISTALERELAKRDVAAFVIEPVQGKGCISRRRLLRARAGALPQARHAADRDEMQTGLGRTGRLVGLRALGSGAGHHHAREILSGGYVPCGAIVTRRAIYQKTFSRLDRCVVHSSTFGRNNLAMACGLATLEVIEDEKLVENAARMGDLLMQRIDAPAREAFVHQGSARPRPDDRDRVPGAVAS